MCLTIGGESRSPIGLLRPSIPRTHRSNRSKVQLGVVSGDASFPQSARWYVFAAGSWTGPDSRWLNGSTSGEFSGPRAWRPRSRTTCENYIRSSYNSCISYGPLGPLSVVRLFKRFGATPATTSVSVYVYDPRNDCSAGGSGVRPNGSPCENQHQVRTDRFRLRCPFVLDRGLRGQMLDS